ncbi:hypothetical protein RJT34_29500 [Clitoria ternatea]|uniref:Uncharacterized protein n=1 Tax=Clitoria ternatea TaxID=43366 RepID=A0AAN9ID63_CLITE
MGSNYFGEPNFGNERVSGSSSSSSRKGKNKNNQDKPKQPQRGLGVAQLEKIRLHGQMACGYNHPSLHHPPYPSNYEDPMQTPYSSVPSSSSFSYSSSSTSYSASYGFQPNIVMSLPEYEGTNVRYGDSHPTNTASAAAQPNITRPLLNLYDSQHIDTNKKHGSGSLGSSSQNSESSDTQEPDLELRLSL